MRLKRLITGSRVPSRLCVSAIPICTVYRLYDSHIYRVQNSKLHQNININLLRDILFAGAESAADFVLPVNIKFVSLEKCTE